MKRNSETYRQTDKQRDRLVDGKAKAERKREKGVRGRGRTKR